MEELNLNFIKNKQLTVRIQKTVNNTKNEI